MSGTISLQARGDVVYARIPEDFPGKISAAAAQVRQQLPGMAIDWVAVREAFLYGRGRHFPVANRHADAVRDEKAKVRFSDDGLTAYLVLFPPKTRGERLDEADILNLVKAYGVPSQLLDTQALRVAHLRRSYHEAEPIARGRPGVDGTPARVAWEAGLPSDTEGFLDALAEREEYPEVVLAEARAGSVMGFRHDPTAGTPGLAVNGRPIPAQHGPDPVVLGAGLTLDGNRVIAERDGHLRLSGAGGTDAVVVPLARVRDAQELKAWSGRVFPGSVIVEGDLEVPFPLRVLGDLEVRGSIVRSVIDVMGSLLVRDGIIHHRGAPIRVGGIASASFLERAWMTARTVHVRRHSLKSRLTALDQILTGPQASIHGGQAQAGRRIAVGALGSQNAMTTEVSAGEDAPVRALQAVFREWSNMLREEAPSADGAPADPALQNAADRWDEVAETLEATDPLEARIYAGSAFPGVTVRVGPALRKIENPIGPVRLTYERIGPRGRVAMTRQ